MSLYCTGVGVLPVSAQDDQSNGGQCFDLVQHPQQVPTQVSRSTVMVVIVRSGPQNNYII